MRKKYECKSDKHAVARTYRSEDVKMLASYRNLFGLKPFCNRDENDNHENADIRI
jgi:hypothetical protein